jgi:hypothetical protein
MENDELKDEIRRLEEENKRLKAKGEVTSWEESKGTRISSKSRETEFKSRRF